MINRWHPTRRVSAVIVGFPTIAMIRICDISGNEDVLIDGRVTVGSPAMKSRYFVVLPDAAADREARHTRRVSGKGA